jgi:chitinase
MSPSPAAVPDPVAAQGPTERLSWLRLGIVVAIVLGAGAAAFVGTTRAVAGERERVPSWNVPYVDVTLTPTYQFQDPTANPARDVALGFVVADPGDACEPSWGGYYSLDQAADELELDRRIAQLRAAGGDALVSFGGQANEELAVACEDPDALRDAYRTVIERYQATTIDLDIEGPALNDTASIERRATVLAELQQQLRADGQELDVWLTLPVSTEGLTAEGLAVVETTMDAGLDLLGVNLMTMNFASESDPTEDMLTASQDAVDATAAQMRRLYLARDVQLTETERWARIGATPMIGQNDVDGEVFTLDDAEAFVAFARDRGLGRVSTWSLNRDRDCGPTFADVAVHSNTCSGVEQEPLAFSKIFSSLPGRAPTAPEVDSVTVPDQTPTAEDPENSPFPIWRPTAQYVQGYKVVWKGSVYQAKWFNEGIDPSTATTNEWETPWALIGPVGPNDTAPTLTTVPPGSLPVWEPATLYQKGATVAFDGLPYQARWSTQGDAPSTQFPVDADAAWQPMFQVPGEPTNESTANG